MDRPISKNPDNLPKISSEVKVEDAFEQFMFMIWVVNPLRDNCRVIMDDGSIKLYLKRDKFLKIMTDLLNKVPRQDLQHNLFRIKESLNVYGGIFFYDRVNNEFRQLYEVVDLKKIRPSELMKESRKSLVLEKLSDDFKNVSSEYTNKVLNKPSYRTSKNVFQKIFSVHRLKD